MHRLQFLTHPKTASKPFNAIHCGLSVIFLTASLLIPVPSFALPNGPQATSTPTADQSKNDRSDVQLAKHIRRDVVKDKTLSTTAHNVQIIAQDGKVTLKGSVRNNDEQKTILAVAQKYAGEGNVVDQLTVAGDNTK